MRTHPRVIPKGRDQHEYGFSLIEILVVLAVLGLLAAIAIPQFIEYRRQSIDAQMNSDLRNAAVAVESYYAKQSFYPASIAEITTYGFQATAGVDLTIVIDSPTAYTITATKPGGSQPSFAFQSATGSIQ
ncbi:MAG TPA: prepilin-type N-terminal cleavage/methylation domain-containing protein [Candidatus Limnocylindria bacterium]|nr:prepilin-type N-terminal cleavage/methylation domain-containing protein [Candidatus Limnocylindria bacterium]